MKQQDILRKKVKLVKAEYEDIYFKDFADYLHVSTHGFYNWLNGYYDLSRATAERLRELLVDLLPDYQ